MYPIDVLAAGASTSVYSPDAPPARSSASACPAAAPARAENASVQPVAPRVRLSDARRCRGRQRREEPASKIQDAKKLVLQGQVAPTYRALKQACNMGQALSYQVLGELHALGQLKRVGRRLELVA